ncbi:MAG: DUF4091 domain-containing protein [Candidatus Omnitrophica bacterium]|nr:DUF4091 domain-containing protein [Candidatus Omnitrophota bacterium]
MKKLLILFGIIISVFECSGLNWQEKDDVYILNNGTIELTISKKRPGEIIEISVSGFESRNFFNNYLSFSPKEKEYLSTWKFLNKTDTKIFKEGPFLIYRIQQDWGFLELIEEIKMEENKDYFFFSYVFLPKTKYYVKRITIQIGSSLKYRVFRSIYGPYKKLENTKEGKWYTYGYDLWKGNRFAENKWFAFEGENGEGVCFVFPEIGNWNTFIGKWKYIWGCDLQDGRFTIEFDTPVLYEREIEDEIGIMDMCIGFYKNNAEEYALNLLKKFEKKKEEKVLPILKINKKINIDGELSEEDWTKGFIFKNFINTQFLRKPKNETEVIFLYDEKGIYVGFKCYDERIEELKMTKTERDSDIWEDDDIEFFFYPEGKYYYQIAINPKGTIYDSKIDKETRKHDKSWNADIKAKTKIEKNFWQGELFIPWKDLGIDYRMLEDGEILLKGDVGRDKKEKFESPREISNIFYSPEKKWHEVKNYGLFKLTKEEVLSMNIKNQDKVMNLQEKIVNIELKGGKDRFYNIFVMFLDGNDNEVFSGNRIIKGGKERQIDIPFEIQKGEVEKLIFGIKDFEKEELIFSSILPVISPKKQIHQAQLLKSEKSFDVFFVSPNVKIRPDDNFVAEKTSPEIKIYSAKNEYEPFQIVINPKENLKLENINIKFTDLVGKDGKIENKNINWRLAGYIDIKTPSPVKGTYPGKWPDPLFVKESFSIEERRNYPIWFTIYVPKDTKEGEYKGEIEILSGDKSLVKFFLTVNVWNFVLPDIANLNVIAGADFLGKLRQNMKFDKLLENYKNHRIASSSYFHYGVKPEDYFEKYKFKEGFLPLPLMGNNVTRGPGQTQFSIFYGKPVDVENEEFKTFFKTKVKEVVEEIKSKRLLDKCYFYLWDEPAWNQSEWVRKTLVGLAKLVREVDPEIKIFISYPEGVPGEEGELPIDLIDIWCPPVSWGVGPTRLNEKLITDFKSKGKKFYVYYNRIFLVDLPAISSRVVPLMMFKYGIDGLLIWSTNYYTYAKNVDPWDPETWYYMKGDGILLYPNEKWDDVIDSIRWELLREGLDDYDYLYYLKGVLEKKKLIEKEKKEGEKLLKEALNLVKDFWNYELDYKKYEEIRYKIGEFLNKIGM